jgi:hypothetical protein
VNRDEIAGALEPLAESSEPRVAEAALETLMALGLR